MAPFVGPTRDALVRMLERRAPRLPITLGHMTPQATVTCDGGVWRLVALAIDREAARRAGAEAIARGDGWMPEQEWQFLAPGRVLVEATTKDDFIAQLRAMTWSFSG